MLPDTLITYYLEMPDSAHFQPAYVEDSAITLERLISPEVSFYRMLYNTVGETYGWRDRRLMSDVQLYEAINAPHIRVYVLRVSGEVAGYVELGFYADHAQIEYIGVFPSFHGNGCGKHLLSAAIAEAWREGAPKICVHTCNLDSASALPNYLKRGFAIVETTEEPMPDRYRI